MARRRRGRVRIIRHAGELMGVCGVWSRLESMDGGSGGMSTRRWCCVRWAAIVSAGRRAADVRRPEKSAGVRLSSPAAGPKN